MKRRNYMLASMIGITGLAGCQDNSNQNSTPTSTEESGPPTTTAPNSSSPDESTAKNKSDEGPVGPRNGDDLPPDPAPDDGYPPAFETKPEDRSIDTAAFDTYSVDARHIEGSDEEKDIRLAPIDEVYYWYARKEARFVDARSQSQYELAHIYGAVSNYALDDIDSTIKEWPKADRIICYCGCPHALSSIRAANLVEAGYEEVYVIDEGFNEWHEQGYPRAGSNIEKRPAEYLIEGVTDPMSVGRTAQASHRPTNQQSRGAIQSDGSYTIELNFDDLSIDSLLSIETPEYRIETTLADAISGVEPPQR